MPLAGDTIGFEALRQCDSYGGFGAEVLLGVAQNTRARVTQVLVFVSIYLHLPRGHCCYIF